MNFRLLAKLRVVGVTKGQARRIRQLCEAHGLEIQVHGNEVPSLRDAAMPARPTARLRRIRAHR